MIKKIFCLLTIILIILSVEIKGFAHQINSKYSIEGDLIKQISFNVPNYTKIYKIPDKIKNATIAVEDKRFFKHHGFDIIAISRAIIIDIKEGQFKQGGSTITQQLAKNLFLANEKKFTRKLKELVLAIELENKYSKEEILEMYLNVIYYGEGSYGVQSASKKYFHKNVWELSLEQCAMLAGLPQAPNLYNPNKHFNKAKKRQAVVLNAMMRNGFINIKEKQKYENKKLLLVK